MSQIQRHPKEQSNVRCCWVCGKASGANYGFTTLLRLAGYDTKGQIGYAHIKCAAIAQRRAKAKE